MHSRLSGFFHMVTFMFCLITFCAPSLLHAQGLNTNNLGSVQVESLSDAQIRQLMAEQQKNGYSDAQVDQMAEAKGVSPSELQKLHERMAQIRAGNSVLSGGGLDTGILKRDATSVPYFRPRMSRSRGPRIFGQQLFQNPHLTFEPDLSIPTPPDYQLGPGDELVIDVYGYSEADFHLYVSKEGFINIPNIGIVYVNGLSMEEATKKIKSKLASIYSGLSSGHTSVQVSIGRIRSIKVTILGEVNAPGTYTLPSLATVFNALYASGGPDSIGSFRNIQVYRAGRLIDTLDVYDFLMRGDQSANIRLQDQDIIRVPTYLSHVEILGQVKRPGIFEMKPGEKLEKLFAYAGGFTDSAYKAIVKVVRLTSREKKIIDVAENSFDSFIPETGDTYIVSTILDKYANRVILDGAVYRPGSYALTDGMTLSQLIKKADGLREDAFLGHGYIVRQNPDLSTSIIQFNPSRILQGENPDILLKKEDVIHIYSIFDLRDQYSVSIKGDVRNAGTYSYSDSMTLEDLIMRAGGFQEGASSERIEVSRRYVDSSNAGTLKEQIAQVFDESVDRSLKSKASSFILRPFDIVAVRKEPGFETQKQVLIKGEVKYPGYYALTEKDERISELIAHAGGLTQFAYTPGASLLRPTKNAAEINPELGQQKTLKLEKLQASVSDTSNESNINQVLQHNDFVGIHLEKILKKPGSKTDIFLAYGDVLNIPSKLQTIAISGEVLYPVNATFIKGRRMKYYISQAGGFTDQAKKGRVYVLYANGFVKSTHHLFFFKLYPDIKPGAEIFVPQKRQPRKVSASEVIGMSSGIASIAALVLAMIRLL